VPGGKSKGTPWAAAGTARIAWQCLERSGPTSLRGYLPIFVSAGSYKGELIKAVAETIRRRDGVPVDEGGQTVRAQLSTGNILVLFDGYSEVEGDKSKALQEMIETAAGPDLSMTDVCSCRLQEQRIASPSAQGSQSLQRLALK
jgi:hypothetical protein